MVECNNTPVCAGFIYQMDSPICSIGSMASDIGQNKDIRSAAVEKMIDHLIIDAKELGYTMTVVTTDKNKLLDRLYKRGFEKFDENLVQVGRAL
ncbi:MAG: hypothetical protein KDD13_00320 [Mangrovimonas sp.]|nr:hypothetical protein [Mangrovimonas sp.]